MTHLLAALFAVSAAPPPPADFDGDPLPPGAVARLGTARYRDSSPPNFCSGPAPLVFSPDGREAFTLRRNPDAPEWPSGGPIDLHRRDLRSGSVRWLPIQGERGNLPRICDQAMTLSPDGKRFAWLGDGGIRVNDLATGRLIRSWPVPDWVNGAEWLTWSGDRLALADQENRVALFDARLGRLVGEVRPPDAVVCGLKMTHGGRLAMWSREIYHESTSASLFDERGRFLYCWRFRGLPTLGFSADGERFLVRDREISLYSWETGKPWRLPSGQEGRLASFRPDGEHFLLGTPSTETAQVWTADGARLVRELHLPGLRRINGELLLATGGGVVVGVENRRYECLGSNCPRPRVLWCWDARTGELLTRTDGHLYAVEQLAFSPDGRVVTTVSKSELFDRDENAEEASQVALRWDGATGRMLSRLDLGASNAGEEPRLLAGDGRLLLLSRSHQLVSALTGRTVARLSEGDASGSHRHVSPDGRLGAIGAEDQPVTVYESGPKPAVHTLPYRGGRPTEFQFSPDGRRLRVGRGEVWDIATAQRLVTLRSRLVREADNEPQWRLSFTPDGRFLVNVFGRGWQAWDLDARREVEMVDWVGSPPEEIEVYSVAFSPDGRLAVGECQDGLTLWETASGQILRRFEGHRSRFAFSPCGRRLATARREDLSVLVWDVARLAHTRERGDPWDDLSSPDAKRGLTAAYRLAATPGATALLARRLRPVRNAEPERLRALLADLGGDRYEPRVSAERELASLGDAARPDLEALARAGADLETRKRAERLLRRLRPGDPERLRERRAVMALELIGDADARALLRRLAGGLPQAFLTREAASTLSRLKDAQ